MESTDHVLGRRKDRRRKDIMRDIILDANGSGNARNGLKILDYRMIVSIVFIALVILLSSSQATAKVSIQKINFNPAIHESEPINISFFAVSNTSNASSINYEIYYEGNIISSTNTYIEQTDYSYSGNYEYVIVAYDDESSDIENVTIEVIDVPLDIYILSPINTEYFNNTIPIIAYTNQDATTTCDYEVSGKNGILSSNLSNLSSYEYMFTGFVALDDGEYTLAVSCNNEFDSSTSEKSFNVFSEPVRITSKGYTVDQGNVLRINIETDYESECRHSMSEKEFVDMDRFSMTNNMVHSTIISGLSEGGHRVYLSCKSYNDVQSYDSMLVTISTRPTATITIDKSGVLRQGTYSVTVKTSKYVQSNPSLSYYFNDDSTPRVVSLAGSGNTWNGYMIIDEDLGNKIGAFKFSAIDLNGVTGNIITEGEIFLIDTIPPSEVENVQAIVEGSDVLISWFYDGDDFENFRIYRSEGEYVGKSDFLKTSERQEFEDKDVEPGDVYTYMVSAIDKAGNEGPLSEKIQIEMPIDESYDDYVGYVDATTQAPVAKQLSKSLHPLVDEKISETEIMILDVDSMQKRMDSITDVTSLKIISLLELDPKIKNAKSSLESILSQLKELKNQDLTQSDLEVRLNRLRLDAIKAQSNVLEELIVEEKGSFEQITQESDVESAVGYMLEGMNISKSQLKEYLRNNKALQDQILVKTESISFKIRNLNQENYDKRTLIHKSILPSGALGPVSVMEIIPKEVENTASDIEYIKTSYPDIIKDDPVVKWDYDSLESSEFYYVVNDIVPLSSLKNVRTIILTKPDFKLSDDAITGMASFEEIQLGTLSTIHWIIILGVGMILLLGTYFVVLDRQDTKRINSIYGRHNTVTTPVGMQSNINSNINSNIRGVANIKSYNLKSYPVHVRQNEPVSKIIQKPSVTSIPKADVKTSRRKDQNPSAQDTSKAFENISEEIVRKIEYCNSVINMMQYERARSIYNDTISALPQMVDMYENSKDSGPIKKLSHAKTKIEAYMHVHNARRHLYYKRLDKFSESIRALNDCYGSIAHNIGFMQHLDNGSEIRFLNFIADNIKQLETHKERMDMINKK